MKMAIRLAAFLDVVFCFGSAITQQSRIQAMKFGLICTFDDSSIDGHTQVVKIKGQSWTGGPVRIVAFQP